MVTCSYMDSAAALVRKVRFSQKSAIRVSARFIELADLQTQNFDVLASRFLSLREQHEFQRSRKPMHYIAKRIASKLAFFEIYDDDQLILFNQLEIEHDPKGRPFFSFENNVLDYMLSISDEQYVVAAFCCKAS